MEHLMVQLLKRDGGTVEERRWNNRSPHCGTSKGGTAKHPMVEQ